MVRACASIGLSFLLLTSCIRDNTVDYLVTNKSSQEVTVVYELVHYVNGGLYVTNDSTIVLESGEEVTLIVVDLNTATIQNPESANDTIWQVNKMEVYKDDTVKIDKEFRLMYYWAYNKINKHHAHISMRIKDSYLE